MIENLRKYPGVIIAALVAVFIGFLLMDSQQFFRSSGANSISVNNVSYDINEYRRLGPSSRGLAMQLVSYQSMDLYGFASALTDSKTDSEDAMDKSFFVNRLLLQKAGREFGIQPGDEEIQKFIRERSVFTETDPTNPSIKKFNQEGYTNFIKNALGKEGMSEADVISLVQDFLIYEKLSALLGGSINVNPEDVKRSYQAMVQKVSATYLTVSLENFKAKEKPTDDELKQYWDLRKDKYKTEVRRKFTFVVGKPTYPDDALKAPEPPKAAKEGDPVPEPSAADKAIMEKRRKAELDAAAKMNDLLSDIDDSKGAEFENEVKKLGWELRSTEFFTETTVPEEMLALNLRKTTKTLTQILFTLKVTTDPVSKFTDSVAIGEADWMIARLDAEEASRDKTFEEAKEEVAKQWIDEKAREALKVASEAAKTKIEEAVKAGKSFADAAKEAGYETKSVSALARGEEPTGHSNAPALFTAAQYVSPGSLTDIITTDDGAMLAIVDKREIVKDPNFDSMLMGGVSQYQNQMRVLSFQAWLAQQNANATVSQ